MCSHHNITQRNVHGVLKRKHTLFHKSPQCSFTSCMHCKGSTHVFLFSVAGGEKGNSCCVKVYGYNVLAQSLSLTCKFSFIIYRQIHTIQCPTCCVYVVFEVMTFFSNSRLAEKVGHFGQKVQSPSWCTTLGYIMCICYSSYIKHCNPCNI